MSFTIDVHHHILPDVFWRETNDAHSPVGGILPAPWSTEFTLSYMDDAEIDAAITSAGGTIPYLATRFSIVDEMNVIPGAEERGPAADTLRRLYWDTALSWRPPVLHMLRSV